MKVDELARRARASRIASGMAMAPIFNTAPGGSRLGGYRLAVAGDNSASAAQSSLRKGKSGRPILTLFPEMQKTQG